MNRLTLDILVNALLAIDKAHTAPQRALDCGPGLGELNQVYGHNCLIPSAKSICGKYNIITRYQCTNRNQLNIIMTAVANVKKGQADISYKGELQTLTKQSMRHQFFPGETCHTTISESTITMKNCMKIVNNLINENIISLKVSSIRQDDHYLPVYVKTYFTE